MRWLILGAALLAGAAPALAAEFMLSSTEVKSCLLYTSPSPRD